MGGRSNAEQVQLSGASSELTGEYLRDKKLADYFEGTERPAFVLTNEKKGIKHERSDETRVVKPGEDCSALIAATDERVLLVVGGNDDRSGPNRDVSLPYTEIRSVETKKGMLKSRLTITARTSDTYHFLQSGRTDFEDITAFIERSISHWVAVERRLEKAKEHLSTIDSRLEAGDPKAAATAYRRTEELLEQATEVAAEYKSGEHAMCRRIDQLDTRLTLTEIRGHRTRGRQLLAEAETARDEDDFLTALDAYTTAQDQLERAADLSEDVDFHAVDEIYSELGAVSTAVSEIRTEPLLRVANASENAVETAEPATDAWQTALSECREMLQLLYQDGDQFDGDQETLRVQIEWVAGNLIEAHKLGARQAENLGDEAADPATSSDAYVAAKQHFESARDVAREFRSGSVTDIESELDRLAGKYRDSVVDD